MPFDFTKIKIEKIWYPNVGRYHQRRYVWAICLECSKGRWVREPWAKHRAKLDGICKPCIGEHPEKYISSYKGHISNHKGYIIRHRKTFWPKDERLLEPMFTIGYAHNYIPEHRAVMALHLGRALKSTEIVHHLDGNKTNNDLSNLRLFVRASDHPKGYGSFYQEWQEALIEIERLKHLVV